MALEGKRILVSEDPLYTVEEYARTVLGFRRTLEASRHLSQSEVPSEHFRTLSVPRLQGYLAHKKPPPPRTLPYAYA